MAIQMCFDKNTILPYIFSTFRFIVTLSTLSLIIKILFQFEKQFLRFFYGTPPQSSNGYTETKKANLARCYKAIKVLFS